MAETTDMAEARRALLEKYLRGEITPPASPPQPAPPTEISDTRTPVVAVQPKGTRTPFFYLHGDWLRGAFFCFPLAHGLGKEQPFYISHPYKLADLEELPTIEEIAAEHLKSIRRIQPKGPYRLGGFCNGALLVHEMALQLNAQGEQVDLLVMMDPMETSPAPKRQRIYRLLRGIGDALHVSHRKQLDWFLRLRYFDKYARHLYRTLRYPHYRKLVAQLRSDERIELLHLVYPPFSALLPSRQELRKDFEDTFNWIACSYDAGYYAGKVTIFWNSEEPPHSFRRDLWRERLRDKDESQLEVHIMAGSHSTCKSDYVADMARLLDACLQGVQASR